jgi:hypothetical protein
MTIVSDEKSIFEPDMIPDGTLLLTEKNIDHFGIGNCLAYSRRKRGALYAVLALNREGKAKMNGHMRVTYGNKADMSKDAFWDSNAGFCCATQDGIKEFRKGGFTMLFESWLTFRERVGETLE